MQLRDAWSQDPTEQHLNINLPDVSPQKSKRIIKTVTRESNHMKEGLRQNRNYIKSAKMPDNFWICESWVECEF